jgi:hypothetical protein
MANEIRVTESITIVKGKFRDSIAPGTIMQDQASAGGGNPGLVTIGTAEEDIAFGSDVAPGFLWMHNIDDTNFIKYGPKSAGAMVEFGRLLPGKTARVYLAPGVTLRVIADTAACDVIIKGYRP